MGAFGERGGFSGLCMGNDSRGGVRCVLTFYLGARVVRLYRD